MEPGSNKIIFRIMSFNIRYGSADDGESSWRNRKELVIQRIQAFNPHLLGLQECRDDEQAAYIKRKLADYEFIGVRRGGKGDPKIEMAPVLYKRDYFEEIDRGYFWLSEMPNVPGSVSWGSALPRTATWVKLAVKGYPNRLFLFLNTHFDHYSLQARHESAKLIREQIKVLSQGNPVILSGDFNSLKDEPPYHLMLAGQTVPSVTLYDTYSQRYPGGGKREGTFHGFGRLVYPIHLDWILVSDKFETLEAGVDDYHTGNIYPSDHYPVTAVVMLGI
jgi:endonuclease/exonuclease/phosphatase family metal-dependent hydrolase